MTTRSVGLRGFVLAGVFFFTVPSPSPAINLWTAEDPNGANGNLWSEPLNWAAGVPINGDNLFFGQISGLSNTSISNLNLSINSITFTPDANQNYSITVQASTLTIAGPGIFNDSSR